PHAKNHPRPAGFLQQPQFPPRLRANVQHLACRQDPTLERDNGLSPPVPQACCRSTQPARRARPGCQRRHQEPNHLLGHQAESVSSRSTRMIPPDLLRRIRNDLPMHATLRLLGNERPPSKFIEGHFRFLCPHYGELNAPGNPSTNLARCFCRRQSSNHFHLLIELGYDFRRAVPLLEQWLVRYQPSKEEKKTHS